MTLKKLLSHFTLMYPSLVIGLSILLGAIGMSSGSIVHASVLLICVYTLSSKFSKANHRWFTKKETVQFTLGVVIIDVAILATWTAIKFTVSGIELNMAWLLTAMTITACIHLALTSGYLIFAKKWNNRFSPA